MSNGPLVANFPLQNVIAWLVVGLVAGIVMHLIDKRAVRGGVLATVVTGALGALLGGFLSALLFGIAPLGLNAPSIILAILGGLIFAFIQRIVTETEEEYALRQKNREDIIPTGGTYTSTSEAIPEAPAAPQNYAYYSEVYPPKNAQKPQANPVAVERYLEGVGYPSNVEGLIKNALQMGAGEEVVDTLERLPDQTYHSSFEVTSALGKLY
jgi:uncharacterized membrane protein YeaQ/YmgE (transglycosylase-associated protein family)